MIRACLNNVISNLCPNQIKLLKRNCHKSSVIHFSWEKPHIGFTKLNFDGASKVNTNNASIGGVYRNHEGEFLLGYSERIGKATSSVAELVAAKRGLELALENGWLNIWMEGDAMNVIDFVARGLRLKSEEDIRHGKEIGLLIPQLNVISASHIYREGNRVAHNFAKLGYKFKVNRTKIWKDKAPNDQVLKLLKHDEEGRVIVRKIRTKL